MLTWSLLIQTLITVIALSCSQVFSSASTTRIDQFESLLSELQDIDSEIKLTKETIEANRLSSSLIKSDPNINIFSKRLNHFLDYPLPKKAEYFKLVQGMSSKNLNVDVYTNKFLFTSSGRTIKLIDMSGGVVMTKEIDFDVKFYSIYSENAKTLPTVYVLTKENQVIFYSLTVNRTNYKNKLSYDLVARIQIDLMLMNPIESWPESYQSSNREIISFKAHQTKNFLFFLLADTKGNIQ